MDIVVSKKQNRLLYIGLKTGEEPNGYPIFDDEFVFIAYAVSVFENFTEPIPEEIQNNPENYCYTPENGFYAYEEPDPFEILTEKQIEIVEQSYRDALATEVSNIGYNA